MIMASYTKIKFNFMLPLSFFGGSHVGNYENSSDTCWIIYIMEFH
jgi:hypothetical protein